MIPLSVPNISGNEWKYIKECLDTNWVSSVGSYVGRFEKMLADFVGSKYAIATSNGTSALHVSLQLAGVNSSHCVIVPNITFIASVNAVKYTGASPIFMDIDESDWQIDLDLLERFLSRQTIVKNGACHLKENSKIIKAIMPVHVLGNVCDMDKLMTIADQYKLVVIEDSTESLGSYFKGKHTGTLGLMGNFSFNGNKIISTGGGGMIVTDDEKLAMQAKHITTQAKASPDEYYHDQVGYNYRLVNLLAAMGVAQMEQLPGFLIRKTEIYKRYISGLEKVKGIGFQKSEAAVKPNNWLFTITTNRKADLLKRLKENGVEARPLWVPMNKLPMFTDELFVSESDVSQKIYDHCVSLPCSTGIKDEEIDQVISLVQGLSHE